MKKMFLIVFVALIYLGSCTNDKGPLPIKIPSTGCDTTVHYLASIVPIVNSTCTASHCHNSGSLNGDFTSYAGLDAKVINGSLLNRVCNLKTMPAAAPLSDSDISKVRCWIEQGGLNN